MDRLQAMEVFRAVIEERAMGRAATRMGLSPASVSRLVAELEAHLGARLLHRTTRTMHPTEEGRAYYERCVGILDQITETERSIRQAREVPTGILRVSAAPAFGLVNVAPLLPSFHARYPAVRVDLFFDDRSVDVIREGYDLALRFSVGALQDSSLIARKIGGFPNVFVASPAYVAAHGAPASAGALPEHPVIVWSRRSSPELVDVEEDGATITVRVDGPIRTDSTLLQREAALAGMGLALVPEYAVREDLRAGRLVAVLTHVRVRALELWAVHPPDGTLAARVRAFVDHVAHGVCS